MIPQAAIQKFRESVRGQSFCPGEPGTHPFRKSAEWRGHPPVDLDVVRD